MKNKSIKKLIPTIFILCATAPTAYAQISNDDWLKSSVTYYPEAYLSGYAFKNGPRDAGEGTFLFPMLQNSDQLLFSSFRFLDKSAKPWEGSFALGYRALSSDHQNLFGVYGGVDRLRSITGDEFNQINIGLEAWQQNWFMGANFYRPYGTQRYSAPTGEVFSSSQNGGYRNIGFNTVTQTALPGVDAEIGRTLVDGLTVYGGGYYFHDNGTKTLTGPKARAEYIFYAPPKQKILGLFDRVGVEAVATYDTVRGTNYYGGLTVGMSWGGGSHANQNLHGTERHMMDRIRRDVDVITDTNGQVVDLPVNVRDVTNADELNQALADPKADVVAVHGQIKEVSHALLDRNVYLTGGTYQTLYEGKPLVVKLSEGGELRAKAFNLEESFKEGPQTLLDVNGVGSQMTIRDLSLTGNAYYSAAIRHDGLDTSMGDLRIEHIVTNSPIRIELEGEGQTGTVDHITDSTLTGDSVLWCEAKDGAQLHVGEISHNAFKTGFGGIGIVAYGGQVDIDKISGNQIETIDYYSGLSLCASEGILHVGEISNNTIDTKGWHSHAIEVVDEHSDVSIGTILNNKITSHSNNLTPTAIEKNEYVDYFDPTDSAAMYFSTSDPQFSDESLMDGQLRIDEISGNTIQKTDYGIGLLFINQNSWLNVNQIDHNTILTQGNYSPGIAFIGMNGLGKSTKVGQITDNQIITHGNSSAGLYVGTESISEGEILDEWTQMSVNIAEISRNTIETDGLMSDGMNLLSSENTVFHMGSCADNLITTNAGDGSDGMRIDADGGTIKFSGEIARNQLNVNGGSMQRDGELLQSGADPLFIGAKGISLRLFDNGNKNNSIDIQSIHANQITLSGDEGLGFFVDCVSRRSVYTDPITAIALHEVVDNQIIHLESKDAPLAWFYSSLDKLIHVNDNTVDQSLGWREKLASLNQMDTDKIGVSIF